jgi:hypothetical protein
MRDLRSAAERRRFSPRTAQDAAGQARAPTASVVLGSWVASSGIKDVATEIVQGTQQGDRGLLTQFGTFELSPWDGVWSGDEQ